MNNAIHTKHIFYKVINHYINGSATKQKKKKIKIKDIRLMTIHFQTCTYT